MMQSRLDLGLPIAFVQALLRILCWYLQSGFVFICSFKFVFQLLFIISICLKNTFILPIYISLIYDLYDISAVNMFLGISFVSFRVPSISTFILSNYISLIYDLYSISAVNMFLRIYLCPLMVFLKEMVGPFLCFFLLVTSLYLLRQLQRAFRRVLMLKGGMP